MGRGKLGVIGQSPPQKSCKPQFMTCEWGTYSNCKGALGGGEGILLATDLIMLRSSKLFGYWPSHSYLHVFASIYTRFLSIL
jgi:hypothetical protein